jgi:spore coat protein U-like protein
MAKSKTISAVVAASFACGSIAVPSVNAATTTASFGVSITILQACAITSANNLSFGSNNNSLSADTDATSTIGVICTATTPYNIGLNQGSTAGSSVTNRRMTDGTSLVNYNLYRESARLTNWGNTVGTDTVGGTGTGLPVSTTVYGRVPIQTSPAPGTYTDTITVTVTY